MFRALDTLDVIASIVAVPVLLILLLTGRFPHDWELWGYAAAGGILLVGIGLAVRNRRRD